MITASAWRARESASLKGSRGGELTTTKSAPFARSASTVASESLAIRSAGVGGTGPAVSLRAGRPGVGQRDGPAARAAPSTPRNHREHRQAREPFDVLAGPDLVGEQLEPERPGDAQDDAEQQPDDAVLHRLGLALL